MIIAIQRRVSLALPIMRYSHRRTPTLELSSHVSHSLVTVATLKSASLIRSCTAETCFPLANKDICVFSDIPTVVQLCGLWEKMAAHPWTCHAKQILLVSHPFPRLCFLFLFCSSPLLQSFVYSGMQKLLLVFCATEQVILMAWNKVCDWLVVLLKFCTFCTAWYNQAEINLLSRRALHSASEDMSHCTSSLTRTPLISGTLHISNSITILHQWQRRGGLFFFFPFFTDADAEAYVQYEGLWLIMDPGRPCHFLSVHVWRSLPLQCNYYVWKCTLIRNVGPDLFQLIAPHPLAEVTGVCPGLPLAKSIVTCINLEPLPCHCGIILNNVHNPSHGFALYRQSPFKDI